MSEPTKHDGAAGPGAEEEAARPDEPLLLEHDADGIREYDNPLPRWWVAIFWATVIWSALYWLNVPGIGIGQGRIANYEREMAEAETRRAALEKTRGPITEAALLAIVQDGVRLAKGKEKYASLCVPCHRADGGGSIGPNLTDEFWIHGGAPLDLIRTVTTGVLDKGMPAWGQVLSPDDLASVVAYITTLRGTNPPEAKEPQGTKVAGGP